MYKFNAVLFVSDDIQAVVNESNLLKDLDISDEIEVMGSAKNGITYISQYAENHSNHCPELIFLKFNNPMKVGVAFLEQFYFFNFSNKAKVKIIFITTKANQEESSMLRVLGDFEFIHEPFKAEKLIDCLSSVLQY